MPESQAKEKKNGGLRRDEKKTIATINERKLPERRLKTHQHPRRPQRKKKTVKGGESRSFLPIAGRYLLAEVERNREKEINCKKSSFQI